jgi:ribosomal protein S18 acetylase RimI-like enzyme
VPGLEIQPFSEEHLDAAGELLAERHRRHRRAEPLLTEPPDYRAEVEALLGGEKASGVVGIREGRAVGYLVSVERSEGIWGPNVWVEAAGHAAEDSEDLRDLYAGAAARWVDEGRTRHYALVPASDSRLVEAWYRLSFGQQHAYGALTIPEDAGPTDGARLANEGDIDAIVEIAPTLPDHQDLSPVFAGGPRETEEELREEIAGDLRNPEIANFVAEADGRVVGNLVICPVGLTSMHSGLARIDGSALLAYAATLPEARGQGAGVAMTNAGLAWARERGYDVMVTDWRVTNLLSSRFWPRRGFRETFLRLYRSIP